MRLGVASVCLLALLAPAGADSTPTAGHTERVEHRDPSLAPARGPTNALVTIELFFVPNTITTSRVPAYRMIEQLQAAHPTRVRLVYRVLKSGSSLLIPSAALEAHAEGKFFEFMEELNKTRTTLKKDDLLDLAHKVGVDPQRVALATQFEHYRDVLDANQRRFDRLHGGTAPNVLFNARPPRVSLGALGQIDLEREYEAAYDRAIDKLDRGFAPNELIDAFDDEALQSTQPVVVSSGPTDDEGEGSPLEHPLASPPLALDGMPAFGKPGVAAPVPIIVLCRPNDVGCSGLLRVIEPLATRLFPDDVRIVWAPWFDVTRDDAADLTLLGDAALCAEAIGSNQGELNTSPGYVWVKEMYAQGNKNRSKRVAADKLIDAVATKLDVDARAMSACRAKMASSTLEWIAAARHSGVTRSPSLVIGGRIYEGLSDQTLIQQLVEAELAPGVLGSMPRWHSSSR